MSPAILARGYHHHRPDMAKSWWDEREAWWVSESWNPDGCGGTEWGWSEFRARYQRTRRR